jgi:hypothetical protein
MKNPKKERFEITELFAAQVNWDVRFFGTKLVMFMSLPKQQTNLN